MRLEHIYTRTREKKRKKNHRVKFVSFENTYPHILADKTTANTECQSLNSKFIWMYGVWRMAYGAYLSSPHTKTTFITKTLLISNFIFILFRFSFFLSRCSVALGFCFVCYSNVTVLSFQLNIYKPENVRSLCSVFSCCCDSVIWRFSSLVFFLQFWWIFEQSKSCMFSSQKLTFCVERISWSVLRCRKLYFSHYIELKSLLVQVISGESRAELHREFWVDGAQVFVLSDKIPERIII